MDIGYFLKLMRDKNASDMFLTTGAPVYIKVEGKLYPLGDSGLPSGMVKKITASLMDEERFAIFERELEYNMAISLKEAGRFRINCFKQRGEFALVIRAIKSEIPTIEQLQLPLILKDIVNEPRGLVLIVGSTGSGKSTALAAMIDHRNETQTGHILTIEDPVEFHIADVQQMQVNRAASFTFASALRNFLRHDPDIIMVGEIRDRETASIAVESALTGHLLLSTLHTNTAATTITRLLDLGVESYLLRASLLAVMAQRLVRLTCNHCKEREQIDDRILQYYGLSKDEEFFIGRGCSHCDGLGIKHRKAIYELMVVSKGIQELIVKGAEADKIHQLAVSEGMRPLTQAAIDLARKGEISLQEAWRVRSE